MFSSKPRKLGTIQLVGSVSLVSVTLVLVAAGRKHQHHLRCLIVPCKIHCKKCGPDFFVLHPPPKFGAFGF
jgi:hypothetical protein